MRSGVRYTSSVPGYMSEHARISSAKSVVAIYPGSFDPLTNGHLDLIFRAAKLVDRLIVAVLSNSQKQPLFTVPERIEMIQLSLEGAENVEVDSFGGLLVEYAAQKRAGVIVRGIRAISDYESELQMALINRRLRPETETIFLTAREEFSYVSSRMIKEIFSLGGDVGGFVPSLVADRLRTKLQS